ncbi:sigma-70 family RNA polymerase sigma factor [Clostridium sp. MB40-C1]|uniref:sigma-70 family RNA polymerase sigma factor n=1 Tax=Clostridium sp. MB40-C1 TaxID=3070996 RepID=UPI0027E08037|nr:sigma-70 family RNA polymerase sigma factor [Clostridium sp. MB40-C1]WMJ81477.1 sigma-70 family RNA polymerase sigma factor [Clostridium sp. MB40-C1]
MEDFIRKAKEGDRAAMVDIISKYKNLILKRASYYKVPGYDFEDLVQHGYLSVIKAVRMYKLGSNSYNGYIINAINLNFAALLKGTIKHYREVPDENILNKVKEYEFTIEDEVIAYDEVKRIYKAIDKLEPLEREILEGYYLNDKRIKDIAEDKEIKYQKGIKIKRQALKKLRKMLEKL